MSSASPSPIETAAAEMSRFAWSLRDDKAADVFALPAVKAFQREAGRSCYEFDAAEYPFDGYCITCSAEQLFQWCESIRQNESDTRRGL